MKFYYLQKSSISTTDTLNNYKKAKLSSRARLWWINLMSSNHINSSVKFVVLMGSTCWRKADSSSQSVPCAALVAELERKMHWYACWTTMNYALTWRQPAQIESQLVYKLKKSPWLFDKVWASSKFINSWTHLILSFLPWCFYFRNGKIPMLFLIRNGWHNSRIIMLLYWGMPSGCIDKLPTICLI